MVDKIYMLSFNISDLRSLRIVLVGVIQLFSTLSRCFVFDDKSFFRSITKVSKLVSIIDEVLENET